VLTRRGRNLGIPTQGKGRVDFPKGKFLAETANVLEKLGLFDPPRRMEMDSARSHNSSVRKSYTPAGMMGFSRMNF
jgi:hypothetical protein